MNTNLVKSPTPTRSINFLESFSRNRRSERGAVPYARSRKFGFTLAEVLIILGITGVVAAITMPVLIEKHQKKVVATSLAKFYSIMSQAVLRYQTEDMLNENIIPPNITSGEDTAEWFILLANTSKQYL